MYYRKQFNNKNKKHNNLIFNILFKTTICLIFVFKILKFSNFYLLGYHNTNLYVNVKNAMEPQKAKANIIITHDIGESSQEYERLTNFLNANNYNTITYDLRNHGQSIQNHDNLGDIEDDKIFINDLHKIITFLKRQNNLKIFLLGHSLGSIINNCYVYKFQDIDGVINTATYSKILNKTKKILESKSINQNEKIIIMDNYTESERLTLRLEEISNRITTVTTRFIYNTMILMITQFQKNLINYEFYYPKPILLLHGKKDNIIDYTHSKELFELIKSPDKTLKLYSTSNHNLLNNNFYTSIYKDILEWLNNRISI
ncbi:MAG: alpha/beta fold hydrolase [Candidatus Phytoplasma australasiaticum]|nr:alpha/beta fold hydrolase [Candidatus Phytoplasma australasiaticum]MDV3153739.1 alpha/beta fold hydrolase [Candidatus Phytoplasma australasiaticum]MDV3167583.1 alpha/beta fold hydrolase [Candidatus Phytoplasma australasiaticum]MDV3180977.1 alpha/beta fold hydrolase [Candidatus Phytoplasma australasiaticum]MDV3183143.1 alpha/beta fold hydrolase [Candidatus Phytoplasma australasiaticum]